jgi:hypothetical protein
MSHVLFASVLGACIGSVVACWAGTATACGGTFCDRGPTPMPVDQRGENILFVMDGKNVQAHIQIQYQGDARRFAWVIPVQAVPEFRVGSQPLFDALLQGSVPTYGYQLQNLCGGSTSSDSSFMGGAAGDSGPSIAFQGTVGAFDVTVLRGGTADEVAAWLDENGYAQAPDAPAILQSYLEQEYVFVAVKLTGGEGVDAIHPLVIEYPGNKPCVPLKLTSVAAVENMVVRTFFLGAERAFPTNFRHVILNPVRIDWLNSASNYLDVVSGAVDSPAANGKAFVTEYAGPSTVVPRGRLFDDAWDPGAFVGLSPDEAIGELEKQRLIVCKEKVCSFNHPLVRGLLSKHLPVPPGIDPEAFYSCIGCYPCFDTSRWNSASFADDIEERIVAPAADALRLLDHHSYLTRLITTISPAEMTEDPEFHTRADQPDFGASHTAALVSCFCSGVAMPVVLPDGRNVAVDVSIAIDQGIFAWPTWGTDMPWAERVEDIPVAGPIIELVDNAAKIDAALAVHDATLCDTVPDEAGLGENVPAAAPSFPPPKYGIAYWAWSATPGGCLAGASGSGPVESPPPSATARGADPEDADGCAIARRGVPSSREAPPSWSIIWLLAAGLLRRRRSRTPR